MILPEVSQDEKDRQLGKLVRALWERRGRVDLHNLFEDGAAVSWGINRNRATGADLDAAVYQAAYNAGIMAPSLPPPRPEQPTLPENFKGVRGPA